MNIPSLLFKTTKPNKQSVVEPVGLRLLHVTDLFLYFSPISELIQLKIQQQFHFPMDFFLSFKSGRSLLKYNAQLISICLINMFASILRSGNDNDRFKVYLHTWIVLRQTMGILISLWTIDVSFKFFFKMNVFPCFQVWRRVDTMDTGWLEILAHHHFLLKRNIKRWRRRRKVPVQITWTDRQNGRWRSDNQRSRSADWRLVSSSRSQNMSCIKESTARRLFPGHPCRFRDLSRRDWSHFSRPGSTGPSQFVHRRLSASQGERE
jgi:hypothetical protein